MTRISKISHNFLFCFVCISLLTLHKATVSELPTSGFFFPPRQTKVINHKVEEKHELIHYCFTSLNPNRLQSCTVLILLLFFFASCCFALAELYLSDSDAPVFVCKHSMYKTYIYTYIYVSTPIVICPSCFLLSPIPGAQRRK